MTRKKTMEPIFCWFTQQFHEEQSTEAYSLWRRNNKGREGCVPLRINKLEDEVVNCTTSLEREELNKWSHDQDKNEAEIQQTEAKKLLLVKETVIHRQMTC